MNAALSHAALGRSHGAKRHPVGLMVVIGLHVLVAGALLTAKSMRTPSAEPPAVAVLAEPYKEQKIVERTEIEPPKFKVPDVYVEPPKFTTEPEPTQVTTTDTKPDQPPPAVHVDGGGEQRVAIAEPVHNFKPRAGFIDARSEQCHPTYPPAAQRAGAAGVSHLRFTIDASGKVMNAQILQASGPTREHRLLDQAAAAALAQCPVTVGMDDTGHAVPSVADVEYVWTLN